MRIYFGLATASIVLAQTLAGCASPAEQQAEQGLTAFQNCDLRSAARSFDSAHSLDPSRPDFALAYALSTIAVLPEDPNVTAVLERLGFTAAIDTSMIWGNGGVITQLSSRNATCQSVGDYLRAHLPYAPAQKNGPTAASVVKDTNLTGNDFVAAGVALLPRLEKLVAALEQGAGSTSGFDITGGCGVGTIHIEAPEVYGLASLLEWLVALIQTAEGYDWGVPATLALDPSGQEVEYAAQLNAHVFRLMDPTSLKTAASTALHAAVLLHKGVLAAQGVSSRPANSLFDWPAAPRNVLSDMNAFASGLQNMLSTQGPQALPFVSPGLSMDTLSFFDSPVDLSGAQPPIWSAVSSSGSSSSSGTFLQTTGAGVDPLLAPRFSPDPFASGAPSESFTLFSGWQNVTSDSWTAAFDPDKRWDNAYGCTN